MTRIFGLSLVQHLFGGLLICMLALAIYGHTFDNPFVFDDLANIPNNRYVRLEKFDLGQLYDVAFHGQSSTRPVAHVSFALNYYFFGGYNLPAFHIVNLVIHVVSSLLVSLLALVTFRRMAKADTFFRGKDDQLLGWLALFSGCLFVAHPLQTQSVTYLVQRMTSMAVMFYLAALLCYIFGRTSDGKKGRWCWWLFGLSCWILSLGTKQIGVTLPFAIFLYEWYFLQDLSLAWLKRSAKYFAAGFLVAAVVATIYMATRDFTFSGYQYRDYTMAERVLTQMRVVMFYVSLVFYPHPGRQSLIHVFETSHSLFDPKTTFLSLLAIVALVGFAVGIAKRWRLLSFAIIWFFLQLALESSIIPLEMAYEHRLYLPLVGVVIAVPWLLHRATAGRAWGSAVAILVILLLASATYVRNQVWEDKVTFWSDVIEKNPDGDARSYNNRGSAYEERQEYDLALRDHERAIELDRGNPIRYHTRASCFFNWGKYEEAVKGLSQTIDLDSRLEGPKTYSKDWISLVYAHRGTAYGRLQRSDLAIRDLLKALEMDPKLVLAYEALGAVYGDQGKYDEAVANLSRAIELVPRDAFVVQNRGILYQKWGKYEEAAQDYKKAISLQTDFFPAYVRLARLLASCPDSKHRNGREAVRLALEACKLTGEREYSSLAALAAAYAELGDFGAAIQWQRKALVLTPSAQYKEAAAALNGYQNGQPYREQVPGKTRI